MDNQFKLYIPSEISSDSNLNLSEMRVLATIKALDNANNCFATNSYLAECLGLSVRQVSRIITSLIKKCYIIVENAKSFKRKIKVIAEKAAEKVVEIKKQMKAKQEKKKLDPKPIEKNYRLGGVSQKVKKFNNMYSHDWDFENIEKLERLKISLDIGEISKDEYIVLAEPLIRDMGMGEIADETIS